MRATILSQATQLETLRFGTATVPGELEWDTIENAARSREADE